MHDQESRGDRTSASLLLATLHRAHNLDTVARPKSCLTPYRVWNDRAVERDCNAAPAHIDGLLCEEFGDSRCTHGYVLPVHSYLQCSSHIRVPISFPRPILQLARVRTARSRRAEWPSPKHLRVPGVPSNQQSRARAESHCDDGQSHK